MKRLAAFFLVALLLLPGLAQAKIFLVDTDDTLRVVTASGVSTIHMYAAWADLTTTALTPGASDAQVTTATTTVLVAAPAASTQRQIKGLSIRNSHGSSSNLITVQFFDGATATELIAYTLLAGETLQWGEDENFSVIDASGQVKGLVAATQSGTWNITNISGTVSLPTGAATAANQDGIIKDGTGDTTQANVVNGRLQVENYNANLAADNSTLSTSKVPVLPGTVSTSAPTWTNGNQSALSLQTDGSVRSAVTNTVTVTASNLDVQIGGSDSLTIGTFPDNEPFNLNQIGGNAVSAGVGASGTGTQRVAALLHDGTDTAQVTATSGGSLQVECTAGCAGSGGTSMTDDAAFTPGTTTITPAGAMFDDVTPDSVNEGDGGVLRMSANRNLYTTLRDAAGNERGANVNASNQLEVAVGNTVTVTDGAGALNVIVDSGSITANAGTNLNTSALALESGGNLATIAGVVDATASTVPSNALVVGGTDGTNTRMLKTDTGGELQVDVLTLPSVTVGTFPDNEPFNVAQINGVTPLMGAGNTGTGSLRVTEATDSQLSAGVGAAGDAAATAGSTGSLSAKLRLMTSQLDTISTNVSSLLTSSQLVDDDQTGASVHYRTSAGSTEDEHEIKGSAGRLFSITATNTNAAVRYLRCANQVIGSTTPGTTTVFLGLAIPGATTGAGFTTNFGPMGIAFSTGLTCWLVTGAADTDVAEVAANEIKVMYTYK